MYQPGDYVTIKLSRKLTINRGLPDPGPECDGVFQAIVREWSEGRHKMPILKVTYVGENGATEDAVISVKGKLDKTFGVALAHTPRSRVRLTTRSDSSKKPLPVKYVL